MPHQKPEKKFLDVFTDSLMCNGSLCLFEEKEF